MTIRELSREVETASAVRIHAYGDAANLRLESVPLPSPGPGEVQIGQNAIGVNFVDVYHRTGLYPLPSLPATLGVEATGFIRALGAGVSGLTIGQRIAYAGQPIGSYTTARNLPAERAIPLPATVADETMASLLLRGITAHMLFTQVWPLKEGDNVLIHAAAGGLGLVLTQWAKALGARVIGTVGTGAKADLALRHGLDHAVLYREQELVSAVKTLTGGLGVDYAIDGIGGQRLVSTLDAVRPFGMVASIGQVSGSNDSPNLSLLASARSVGLSRPSVFRFMGDLANYREGAAATLDRLSSGLRATISEELTLAQAAEAHRLLESGKSVGSVILRSTN